MFRGPWGIFKVAALRKARAAGAWRIGLQALLLVACATGTAWAQEGQWRALNSRVQRLTEQRKYAEARPIAEEALREAQREFGPTNLRVAVSLQNLAYLHLADNDFSGAERLAQQALSIAETAAPSDPRMVGEALNTLSQINGSVQRFSEAESYARRALATQQKALPADDPDLGVTLANLATLYLRQFQYAKYPQAEEYYKRAIAIFETAGAAENFEQADALGKLARFYFMSGRNAEAVPLLQREIALLVPLLGANHPAVLLERQMLAGCQAFSNQNAGAEETLRGILATELANAGPGSATRIADTYDEIGRMQRRQGKNAEAEESTLKAVQEIEKGVSPQSPAIEQPLEHLAEIYKDEKKYAAAEQTELQRLEVLRKNDPRDVHAVMTLQELVKLAEQQGHLGDAASYDEQIIAYWDNGGTPNAAIDARESYAALLRKMNRNDEAAAVEAQAKELRQRQEFAKLTDADITQMRATLIMLEMAALQKGFGPDYDRVADSLVQYAAVLRFKGRTAEANEIERRAQSMREHGDYAGPESFAQWYLERFDQTAQVRGNAAASAEAIEGLNHLAGLLRRVNRPSDAAKIEARAKQLGGKVGAP